MEQHFLDSALSLDELGVRLASDASPPASAAQRQLEADVAFFASQGKSTTLFESHAGLSPRSSDSSCIDAAASAANEGDSNALGLLDNIPNAHFSAPPMLQSQSMSALDFLVLSNHPQARRPSISDLSDASGTSFTSSHFSQQSFSDANSPGSLVDPSQQQHQPLHQQQHSPLRALSSLSGLALGTPVRNAEAHLFGGGQQDPSSSTRSSPGAPQQISTTEAPQSSSPILTLSKLGAPPMMRRDTALAHSLYTNQGKAVGDDDDATPMPPTMGRFVGQRAANDVAQAGAPPQPSLSIATGLSAPFTPSHGHVRMSAGSAATSASSSNFYTPSQSNSATTTPLSQTFGSPYGGAPPGARWSTDGFGVPPPVAKSLEAMFAQREMQLQQQQHQNQQHHHQEQVPDGHAPQPHHFGMPEGHAPLQQPIALNSAPSPRSTTMIDGNFMTRSVSLQGEPGGSMGIMPSTPARPASTHSGVYPAHFTAPLMHASRSVGHLASPAPLSPLSLGGGAELSLDGHLPPSAGALPSASGSGSGLARGTPRSRARNSGPPPLIVSSADKLHVCHCGKRFKRMEHLKRHNRTHTQERPHRCPFDSCGKWFGRSDNLAQHLKTHFRAVGSRSAELLALSRGEESEPRHNPHAAATAAAAAAAERKTAGGPMRRRSTVSAVGAGNPALAEPVSLSPTHNNSGSVSPVHPPESNTWIA